MPGLCSRLEDGLALADRYTSGMDARQAELPTSLGLLILRLGVGGYMLTHGLGKLDMVLAGSWDKFGDPIGLGNTLSLLLTTFAEFLCSLLVILGLWTRLAAIPVVIAMAVAAFVVHGADPWTMEEAARRFAAGEAKSMASRQPALLFLIPFLALAFAGGGRFTIAVLWRRETPPLS
jgi:putative oxidoreductase